MNVELLENEVFIERNLSGLKAVDMFFEKYGTRHYKKYVEERKSSEYETWRNLNYLVPNILYTFSSRNEDITQEKINNKYITKLSYYDIINVFIQLCFTFERMRDYVIVPFDFQNIKIIENYCEYSFDIDKTNYTIRSDIIPVITNFIGYTKNKLNALKSLFTKAVSYYNLINHETATRVPVDEEGAILYNIFNADFYIINNEKSPKEALKILIQKHKIVKDVFENIVIYRRKNELENILTNPRLEYNRLTNSQNYKSVLDSCFLLKNDYLYLEYCLKILNTFPVCTDVRDKISDIQQYMIKNDIKYDKKDEKIYNEIVRVELVQLAPRYIPELLEISMNPEVMKTVGKGDIWDKKKWMEKVYKPYNWVILKKGAVVGYIALHRFLNFNNALQIRIFIHPYSSGMGIGSTAIKLLKEQKINKFILGVVSVDNKVSQKMLEKAGMIFDKSEIISGELHYIYGF